VVRGVSHTARAIGHYAWITVAVSSVGALVLPTGGWLYALLLGPFNGRLLQLSRRLVQLPEDPQRARHLFRWSILYLFGICLLLVMARLPQAAAFDPLQQLEGMALATRQVLGAA
jgi:protoheme IX farnesyltransferase